ncbi:MAG: glutamine--tRNA ligase/YqeY domain fusion protein [Acidobacteriota bacterium]|nr:glutamine--tRNA ligase/YqeY domain fusion protein [Acidobacteriota bacterium]
MSNNRNEGAAAPSNFIRNIIEEDLRSGKHDRVVTRFPPEPNGYLHIGHAKSICLNFGLSTTGENGRCHLRFDDTNPETEDMEFVESIQRDIRWLGFEWNEHLYFASGYFDRFYELAIKLIEDGKAYVDSQSLEEMRANRGTVTQPGKHSPYRERSVAENLDLFERMARGEFPEGAHVLRAKIDMASPNMKMRDPLLYRIRHAHHYRTGDKWHIYPMYDYAHCLSDSFEGVTHSVCTLEFENNRELYDWVIRETGVPCVPRQYEFARLGLNYTVMSKRKLKQLVEENFVSGWDDPRMPTIAGMRRRGYTPSAIRDFCERIGVAKANSTVDIGQLEFSVRNDLNAFAPRVMCVLDPLKVTLTNFPAGKKEEMLTGSLYPHDIPLEGEREIPFSREIYIERSDFMEDPPKKFHRLAPGREVRLRHGYVVRCDEVIKNGSGAVVELRCSYDPDTLGKNPPDRKIKGTIHWVSVNRALSAEVRLYDRLFKDERPDGDKDVDFKDHLNPDSLKVVTGYVEPCVADDEPGSRYQFERQGYFISDPVDSDPDELVFNRTVSLRDSWSKIAEPAAEQPKTAPKPKPKATAKPAAPKATRERTPQQQVLYDKYRDLGLSDEDADLISAEDTVAGLFEDAAAAHDNPKGIANWVVNEVLRALKDRDGLPFDGAALGELVKLIDEGTISGKIGKDVFEEMLSSGEGPAAVVERKGLRQVSDAGALEPIIDQLIAANPDKAARYREGKKSMMGFFVGQVMKQTGGKANPQLVNQLIRSKLD